MRERVENSSEFILNQTNRVRIIRVEDRVVDIQIWLSGTERQQFLKKFDDKKRHWKTSCITYLVQNEIAKYRNPAHPQASMDDPIHQLMENLYELSTELVKLESLINKADLTDQDKNIADLRAELKRLYDMLPLKISSLLGHNEISTKLNEKLTSLYLNFGTEIDRFESSIPTTARFRKLFSAQNEGNTIGSIGTYLAQVYYAIITACIERVYEIRDNEIIQLFFMDRALQALSDIKSSIEKKHLSLYGARYINTHAPIPESMQHILMPPDPPTAEEERYFSILPYLKRLDNIEEIDQILCHFTGADPTNKTKANFVFSIAILLANIIEIVIAIPIRLVCSFVSVVISMLGRFFHWISSGYLGFYTQKFDQYIADTHHTFSLVRWTKNRMTRRYTRLEQDSSQQPILEACKNQARSLYNDLFTYYFSGNTLADQILQIIRRGFAALTDVFTEGAYLFSTSPKARAAAFTGMEQQVSLSLRQKFNDFSKASDNSKTSAAALILPCWTQIAPWPENSIPLPLEFVDDIAVGLADIIGAMFRRSPGASTLWFIVSQASLGVLMIPSLAPHLGIVGNLLYKIPAWFSLNFTGSPVEEGLFKKVVATFIEWKAFFFSTEVVLESSRGDFEFLDEIFYNPEKLLLGTALLVGIGYSLRFIPPINNPVAGIINFFSHEARNCLNGTAPFTGLEYAFLGLKFSLLTHSLLSGTYRARIKPAVDFRAINAELRHANILGKQDHEITPIINQIFARHVKVDLDRQMRAHAIQKLAATVQQLKLNRNIELPRERASEDARPRLAQALSLVQQMTMMGEKFSSRQAARLFFDELSDRLDAYNEQLKWHGRFDLVINKSDFLHSFYNKFCYKGSNNLMRLISLVIYPLTYVWRKIKYGLAATERFHSPCIQHQVEKSFAKDRAICLQIIAFSSRFLQTLVRAYTYAVRTLLVVGMLLVTLPCAIAMRSWRDTVYGWARQFSPHHANLTAPLHAPYAQSAREADTSDADLLRQCDVVHSRLLANLREIPKQTEMPETREAMMTYYNCNYRPGFFTDKNRPKQLERIARVIHNNHSRPEKTQKVQLILAEMNSGSQLRALVEPTL